MAETQSFVTVASVQVPVSEIPWDGTTGAAQAVTLRDPISGSGQTITAAGAGKVDGSGVTQPVSAAALPLPAGAATEASLAAVKTAVQGTLAVAGAVTVSNFPATQPVSAAALPLPTGAATETTLAAVKTAVQGTLSVNVAPAAGPGYNSAGTGQFVPCADAGAAINCGAAATQTLVAGVAGKRILVCFKDYIANGTGTVQFTYGAANTPLDGAQAVTAETGITGGSGYGLILPPVPAGQDLKITTTGTATAQGCITYTQAA